MSKSQKPLKSYTFNPQTSIYISDSEDEEEGKLVIDEATSNTTNDNRANLIPPLKPNLQPFFDTIGKTAIPNVNDLHHLMVQRRNQISVKLRSALTQSKFIINHENISSNATSLPQLPPAPPPPPPPYMANNTPSDPNKCNRPYTNFNIATLLSTPFRPIEGSTEPSGSNKSQQSQTTANETIYYALTPDYKCTICNPNSNKMNHKSGFHHISAHNNNNNTNNNMHAEALKHHTNPRYTYLSMNKKPEDYPTYCLMPTTPTASYKAAQNLNPTIKRIRPYDMRTIIKNNLLPPHSRSNLIQTSLPPPLPPPQAMPSLPPANISAASLAEKDSILRSIIQSANDVYKVILSIQILASKFLPPPEPKQSALNNYRTSMLLGNVVDLNKSVHYLMSYGDMRLNLIRIQSNYICIHLLKDYDNSIIDFRTLSKAETLVIRDTVRFGTKWNIFCILLQNNLLDRESTLLYNHIFHKY